MLSQLGPAGLAMLPPSLQVQGGAPAAQSPLEVPGGEATASSALPLLQEGLLPPQAGGSAGPGHSEVKDAKGGALAPASAPGTPPGAVVPPGEKEPRRAGPEQLSLGERSLLAAGKPLPRAQGRAPQAAAVSRDGLLKVSWACWDVASGRAGLGVLIILCRHHLLGSAVSKHRVCFFLKTSCTVVKQTA